MVWSEYVNETDPQSRQNEEEASAPPLQKLGYFGHGVELVYSDWVSWYADDLQNMWSSLVEYKSDALVDKHILNLSNFDIFCEFCYIHSSKLQDYRK